MKRLLLALLALVALPVFAQSGDASRQFEAGRTADFNNWVWRANKGAELTESEKAIQAVLDAISRKDYPGAVAALNAGIAKGLADVMLLAGALFEEGACVKPSWERAVGLYQRALGAGQRVAAARLSAGYAAPVGGTDKAAALWWAQRAKTALPADCAMPPSVGDDPDRFVAVLKDWPAERLNACVYAAGVMATIQGEVDSPAVAAGLGMVGTVNVTLVPEQRQVAFSTDLSHDATAAGRVGDGGELERTQQAARKAFDAYLQTVASRAIARYERPAAVPAGWRVQAQFVYKSAR